MKKNFVLKILYLLFLSVLGITLLAYEAKKDAYAFRDFESFFLAGRDILQTKNIYALDFKKDLAPINLNIPGFINTVPLNQGLGVMPMPTLPALVEFEYMLKNIIGVDPRTASPLFTFPYIYPPLLAYILSPFKQLGFQETYFLWLSFSFILVAFYPFASEKFLEKHLKADTINFFHFGILGLFVFSFAIYDNFFWTQVNFFILSLLMIALNYEEKKPLLAGISFAIACMIKMSPLILLIYFLFRKNWTFLAATVVSLLLLFVATLLFGGFPHWKNFFEIVADISRGDRIIRGLFPIDIPGNFSLKAYIYRTLPANTHYTELLVYGTSIVLLLGSILEFLSKWFRSHSDSVFLYRLIFLMYLLSPIAWLHHMIFFYPAFLLLGTFMYCSALSKRYKVLAFILFSFTFIPAWEYTQYLPKFTNVILINQINSLNFIFLIISFFLPNVLLFNLHRSAEK